MKGIPTAMDRWLRRTGRDRLRTDPDPRRPHRGPGVQQARRGQLGAGRRVFAFKLINNTGSPVTVTQLQFQLSSVSGIAQGDVGNFLIYQDDDNNGAIALSETTTVGGAGAVNAGMTTITFSTSFSVSANPTVNTSSRATRRTWPATTR